MIRVLPPELANQIAAGEVVERPASVIKELVENALDAGATRIRIDVEAGGRRLMRVADDGSGMTPDDARLALLRHATSKLSAIEDLQTLTTMGFRGEALPAIASVSRLTLITRPAAAVAAFRLEVEAGQTGEAREVGAPPGTTVEVRDLFYNVPARLKFLKSETTEAAQVSDTVTRLALAQPLVHFTLRHNGRVVLDVPPSSGTAERVRAVLGPRLGARLIEGRAEAGTVAVQIYLAPPDEALTSARGVFLFVAQRPVRDRGLLAALAAGYAGLLAPGRYPQAVLLVDPGGAAVDVNVHPQKAEVRFARAGEVYAAVREVTARTIADAPWAEIAEAADADAQAAPPLPGFATSASASPEPRYLASAPPRLVPDVTWLPTLGYLGQLDSSYLVCTGPGELVLVDLHAARELVALRRLTRAQVEHRMRPQRLLFPARLEAEPALVALAAGAAAALAEVGFEVAATSPTTLSVRAAPADLPGAPEAALRELLVALAAQPGPPVRALLEALACVEATRAPAVIDADAARALLEALDGAWLGHERPHGRPVIMRVPIHELLRRS